MKAFFKLLLAGIPAGIAALPAHAQQVAPPPFIAPPVVVTATRVPTPSEEVATSVTVITGDDLERRQSRSLADALRDVPGLNLVQSGSAGGTAQVFMRGANANHTKVLIDGMPVNNPGDLNGVFDFGPVLAADIERIEVLRGPQSGLYGSDAIGGVVNIITRKGSGPLRVTGSVEGGSFETFNQQATASGSLSRFNYAVTAAHAYVGGVPVTPLNLIPPGRERIDDNYENSTFSTKLGADLTENFGVSLVARYSDIRLGVTTDDLSVFPSVPNSGQSRSETRQFFTRGEGRATFLDGALEQRVGVGYVDYRDRFANFDSVAGALLPPTYTRSDRTRVDWLSTAHVTADQVVLLGLEREREALRDSPISASNTNNAGFAELQSGFSDRLFTSATVRVDGNERFGTVATWRIAPAYLIPESGTKLKGSVGTGFKAPTLTQLFVDFAPFNFFANPNLQPERSFGWDAGFEQAALEKKVAFGATYFHNDFDDLIVTNATGTSFENRPKATSYGVESFAAYRPIDPLSFRADYTFTLAQDDTTHEELRRRPHHKASLTADWRPTAGSSLSATALYVGARVDGNRDFSIQRLTASSYTLLNLAGSIEIVDGLAAFGRIENALDRRYEDPTGLQRPGLGIYAGLKIAFGGAPGAGHPNSDGSRGLQPGAEELSSRR
jgi:vitamin B12 transporter